MKWSELFNSTQIPSYNDIEQFIGEGASIWSELLSYIEESYQVQPKITFSQCSAQPGWNIKFQKSGKSLCTIYPMEGFFITLVVVGVKEEAEVEMLAETFTPYVQKLYRNTSFSCGGRWLMVEVINQDILDDIKRIIAIRVKPKSKVSN